MEVKIEYVFDDEIMDFLVLNVTFMGRDKHRFEAFSIKGCDYVNTLFQWMRMQLTYDRKSLSDDRLCPTAVYEMRQVDADNLMDLLTSNLVTQQHDQTIKGQEWRGRAYLHLEVDQTVKVSQRIGSYKLWLN